MGGLLLAVERLDVKGGFVDTGFVSWAREEEGRIADMKRIAEDTRSEWEQ